MACKRTIIVVLADSRQSPHAGRVCHYARATSIADNVFCFRCVMEANNKMAAMGYSLVYKQLYNDEKHERGEREGGR